MSGEKKSLKINKDLFLRRTKRLYDYWKKDEGPLGSVNCVVVAVGADENSKPYSKSNAFQTWLYSCELLDTVTVAVRSPDNKIVFLGSGKKAEYFDPATGTNGEIELQAMLRDKTDKDEANFGRLISLIKESGGKMGYFAKDKFSSAFCDAWEAKLDEADIKKMDVTSSFVNLFAVKDEDELTLVKNAAAASVNAWGYIRKKYVDLVDRNAHLKHSQLSTKVDDSMTTVEVQGALAKNRNIETCYSTIIQSGGSYNFKWSTQSTDKAVQFDAITTSLGARFENYCSNVGRTLLIQPSKALEEAYENVLVAQNELIRALTPGAKLKDAYEKALKALKPELRDKLYKKELGFATGIEFREGALTISSESSGVVEAGMVFIVLMAVSPLEFSSDKEAAILISDTVHISTDGPNEILTEKAKNRLKSNVVRFTEEEEETPRKGKGDNKENEKDLGRGKRSVVITEQTRNKTTNEEKRKEHQKELADQINDAAKARLAALTGQSEHKRVKKSNVSYKSYDRFPKEPEVNNLNIYVDKRHDSVILPIFGIPVPFHISMIKNCSQSVEGEFTYLRINFAHPGSQVGKESINFPNPLAEYVKELTYRATNVKEPGELTANSNNLQTAFRLIKDMQKKFRTEEAEEREKEGAVKQDKLALSVSKANPKMKDLFVRPNIIAKRISGSLEAHTNGFRYTSLRGDKIDVLYNNIKHAFFQPCDGEMIILLHFHLKNPVLWGKKKYQDIQFYTEVGEVTTDLGKYHHMQDRDDIQSEQMEREMRRKLNQAFQSFCDKVVRQTNDQLDFDTPFSELGFVGVPHRSSCTLKPTSTCLVNLTEWPPFAVTLEEVELVHFERVSFQLKNFDMVFIFKDYSRKTQMVQQIPMSSIDSIKEWLNSCDIRYTEGIQSLNWPKIMKTIVDDPEDFFENGGWNFLRTDSDNEEDDEEESDSEAYSPEESNSEEGSESDEDESEGEETESDGEGSLDSDESSGKEWSELEEEAEKDDRIKERDDRDKDRDHDRKRHGSSHHKGGPPSKKRR